jgi:hypothetical protein
MEKFVVCEVATQYLYIICTKLTRLDNKAITLVAKKVLFYLFIKYNVVTFKVHPLWLHKPFPEVLP